MEICKVCLWVKGKWGFGRADSYKVGRIALLPGTARKPIVSGLSDAGTAGATGW